jgi:hypothetical protein
MGKGKRLKDDRTKAAKLLAVGEMLKPGKGIVWTVYNGGDVLDAEAVHNHVKPS